MPGETFEGKVERFTERLGTDVEVDVSTSIENQEDPSTDADE